MTHEVGQKFTWLDYGTGGKVGNKLLVPAKAVSTWRGGSTQVCNQALV